MGIFTPIPCEKSPLRSTKEFQWNGEGILLSKTRFSKKKKKEWENVKPHLNNLMERGKSVKCSVLKIESYTNSATSASSMYAMSASIFALNSFSLPTKSFLTNFLFSFYGLCSFLVVVYVHCYSSLVHIQGNDSSFFSARIANLIALFSVIFRVVVVHRNLVPT